MDLKQALISSSAEIFPTIGLQPPTFLGDTEEVRLISANQINILIGMNGGMKGNVIVGLNKPAALRIVSEMSEGKRVSSLDPASKSSLGKISKMILESAVGKVEGISAVSFSPPTIVTGLRLFLMMSRNKTTRINFKIENDLFSIAYSLE